MNTDTILAALTPHEAVLNPNAAELMGRKRIAALNAKGNKLAKRGVDLPSRRYQKGTSDVEHEDQGESMMKSGHRFTPQDLAEMHKQREAEGQARRARMMNEKPVFQFQSGTSDVGSDRADLLKEAEETFYGGGQAQKPVPTPTPTPKPRKYQYGTSNVRRAVDFAAPSSGYGFSTRSFGGFGGPQGSTAGITFTGSNFGREGVGAGGSPASGSLNTNPVAISRGINSPFGTPIPDLSKANPATLGRLNIGNLIYSANAGGYLTRAEAENANSWYNKFGQGTGGDPGANRAAAAYYGYIGSLPTRPIGTPALNMFYGAFGGGAPSGPSFNSILGNQWQGPYQFGVKGPSSFNPGGWTGSDF